MQGAKDCLPVELQRPCLLLPAMNCDNTGLYTVSPETQHLKVPSSHLDTRCLVLTKTTPQCKASAQHKLRCLHDLEAIDCRLPNFGSACKKLGGHHSHSHKKKKKLEIKTLLGSTR